MAIVSKNKKNSADWLDKSIDLGIEVKMQTFIGSNNSLQSSVLFLVDCWIQVCSLLLKMAILWKAIRLYACFQGGEKNILVICVSFLLLVSVRSLLQFPHNLLDLLVRSRAVIYLRDFYLLSERTTNDTDWRQQNKFRSRVRTILTVSHRRKCSRCYHPRTNHPRISYSNLLHCPRATSLARRHLQSILLDKNVRTECSFHHLSVEEIILRTL